jgi:hypothetical protein
MAAEIGSLTKHFVNNLTHNQPQSTFRVQRRGAYRWRPSPDERMRQLHHRVA